MFVSNTHTVESHFFGITQIISSFSYTSKCMKQNLMNFWNLTFLFSQIADYSSKAFAWCIVTLTFFVYIKSDFIFTIRLRSEKFSIEECDTLANSFQNSVY